MTKVQSKVAIDEGLERHDFGVVDTKGRAIGAHIRFQVREQVETTNGYGYEGVPGTYFCCYFSATRGGAPYGATQSWNYFTTEKERIVAVEKYLKGAASRAKKTAGVK